MTAPARMVRTRLITGDAATETPSAFLKRAFPERYAEVEWQRQHRAKYAAAKTNAEFADLWLEEIAHSLGMPFDELNRKTKGQWL